MILCVELHQLGESVTLLIPTVLVFPLRPNTNATATATPTMNTGNKIATPNFQTTAAAPASPTVSSTTRNSNKH